jgi:hypothetical protein
VLVKRLVELHQYCFNLLTYLRVDGIFLLSRDWQSKADCECCKGKYCADFYCLLLVLVCAESSADVKHYLSLSSSERRK